MKRNKGFNPHVRRGLRPKKTIKTTMFHLISALNEEVRAEERALVPLIVLDMMETGSLRFMMGHPNKSILKAKGKLTRSTALSSLFKAGTESASQGQP